MILNKYTEEIFQLNENIIINYDYFISFVNFDNNLRNELSLEKPKILRKLKLDVLCCNEDKKKLKTSKSLFQMKTVKQSIKEDKIDCSIYVTENNYSNNDTMQYTNLEYENVTINNQRLSRDTFIDFFFLTGLPKKGSKVIQDSEKLNSVCMHKECSILQSYRPEILYKLPLSDPKDFILNSSVIIHNIDCFFLFSFRYKNLLY